MNRVAIVFLIIFNIVLATYYGVHMYHIFMELYGHPHTTGEEEGHFTDNEFRKLDKYQPIPAGMHVRVNLQTGEREGKWLSKQNYQNDRDTSLIVTSDTDKLKKYDMNKLKYQHLENAIKNIPNEITADDDREEIKRKFRSYEQLKNDMSDLKLKMETEAEVVDKLMKKCQLLRVKDQLTLEDQVELVDILKDFEFLVHQVDNARDFVKQNGMISVILPTLTSNSTTLRTMSAKVLGAAVQNNGFVQIAALKAGVIPHLLRNIALEKDFELRASSIYAISCLVRSFPLAEMKLIDEGGLSILMKVFDETSDESLKLQLKVVTMFGDLIVEKEDAKLTMEEKEKLIQNVTDELPQEEFKQIVEKFRQYSMVELNSKLIELSWCANLGRLLVSRSFKKDVFNENDILNLKKGDGNHEVVDDVTSAIAPIINQCREQFLNEPKVNIILPSVLKYYEKLARDEKDDTFYHDIYKKVNNLCTVLKLK